MPTLVAAVSPPSLTAMAGKDPCGGGGGPIDACPLYDGAGPPLRVAISKRALPADATLAVSSAASVAAAPGGGSDETFTFHEQLVWGCGSTGKARGQVQSRGWRRTRPCP